jgi:hypothetical protein
MMPVRRLMTARSRYEDYLHDLGLATLRLRFRRYAPAAAAAEPCLNGPKGVGRSGPKGVERDGATEGGVGAGGGGGWELRLRWWAVVNPACTPRRGLPHARLRDTTYRCFAGDGLLLRRSVREMELHW